MNRTTKLTVSGLILGPLAALAVLMGSHTAPAVATVPAPAPVTSTSTSNSMFADCMGGSTVLDPVCMAHHR